jgi:hypothetical protein
LIKNATDYSRTCFKEVMGFLKTSPFFHTRLAGDMHPADGEFLQVALNREEFMKLRRRTRIPVISGSDEQQFKPEQTKMKNYFSGWSLLSCRVWSI